MNVAKNQNNIEKKQYIVEKKQYNVGENQTNIGKRIKIVLGRTKTISDLEDCKTLENH